VLVKQRLSDSVTERYYVRKDSPNIKQGPYTALFRRKVTVAKGNYTKNIKTGIWQFFGPTGTLVEKYNYDQKRFTYETPPSATDKFTYLFDDSLKVGDKVSRPVKIGGIYYGYITYLNLFKLPFGLYDIDNYYFVASLELLVSPMGRLADYKVHVVSDYYQYDQTFHFDVKLIGEEDRIFLPATLNGKPVMSRILIKCFITNSGGLDFY
jgi:hypothetical protein